MMDYYPYQTRVSDAILSGENIILQAPTGAGKTRAALLPFLESLHDLSDVYRALPPRCIYSVPMRVLATQFVTEYRKVVSEYASREGLGDIDVRIQTGENQQDRELTGNLIFATIDQTLSSFLISPYSLSKRKANLNAGAVMSSYLVFDEFHLFEPDSTLPTTLHMLKMLKGITPFILMTATFSQSMLRSLAEELDAVVVGNTPDERAEFQRLPSQQKTRVYRTVENVLTAEAVLQQHQGRSLVICNQVDRARMLFEQIQAQTLNSETQVLLLHSRFLSEDRRTIEDRIRRVFGRGADEGDYIVVSTPAIEVGLDITSTVLHTELAPANAIIQRAGRCARYQDETGHVYIYLHAHDKDGEVIDLREHPLPYKGQGDVISNTWTAFCEQDGQVFDFDREQAVLSSAHAAADEQIIADLKGQNRNHQQSMYAVMRGDPGSDALNLIRNIIQQPVTIHNNPDEVAKNPFAYPSFGLHPGTVQGYIDHWLEHAENGWQVAIIRESEIEHDFEDEAQTNEDRYYPFAVTNKKAGWMAPLLVVHPNLASYDPVFGFMAERGGGKNLEPAAPERELSDESRRVRYRLETYEQHIAHVYLAFETFWPEAEWAACRLEERFNWPEGSVTRAAQLAVLLHDVGKLSKGWQAWVHQYQQALHDAGLIDADHLPQTGQAYAHSDFDSNSEAYRYIQKKMGKRPWHAVEGSLAAAFVVAGSLNNRELAQAVFSAIARHHAAHSDNYRAFQLTGNAAQHVQAALLDTAQLNLEQLEGMDSPVGVGRPVDKVIAEPSEGAAFLAYLLIVRALRRADVLGTMRGSKGAI